MKKFNGVFFSFFFLSNFLWPQDKPASKISGYMFGDYFYNVSRDTSFASLANSASGGTKDLNGFQFRRIYFTYDNEISSIFSTRFRLEGTTGSPIIKDAYVKWKEIFTGSELLFGIQPTPAFEVSESYWGYRSLEKTILDLRGIVSSRDLGVSVKGKIDTDGTINYWILYGNNSGTGAEADKYKRIYAHIDLKPADKFRVTVYADYKMQAGINDPASTLVPKSTLGNNVLSTALFLGYTEKGKYSFGAEGFYQIFNNGYIHGLTPVIVEDKNSFGLSFFGSYVVSTEISLIGRYDYFDPNIVSAAKYDVRNYIVAGASWSIDKNVSVIPNILLETYENAATASGSRLIDPAVTGRVTIYYVFL